MSNQSTGPAASTVGTPPQAAANDAGVRARTPDRYGAGAPVVPEWMGASPEQSSVAGPGKGNPSSSPQQASGPVQPGHASAPPAQGGNGPAASQTPAGGPPAGAGHPGVNDPAAYGPGTVTGGINKSQVAEAVRAARQSVTAAASRNARRNRLQLRRIDPWSVMKFSFAASLVLFIAFVVATALLYTVLDAMGVFDSVNETVKSLTSSSEEAAKESSFALDAKMVIGGAALLGAVNMVLFTATTTLGAFIYNVCADLAGGIEVTLAERE